MIRRVVQEENPSLSGIAMLLRELWFTDALRLDRKNTVVDDKSFQRLMDRCLTATTPSERAGAGYLIEALDGYHPGREAWILEHASIIGRWLTEATAESSWGLSWLVNALNESSENSSAVFSHVNPFQIAASVNSAPLSQAYAWNNLLSRLALGGEEWRNYFRAALIAEPFLALARSATKMEVEYVCTLAAAFSRFDQELALDMVTCASTPIARYISEDFPRAYSKFDDTWNYVFNFVALVLGIRRLSKSQKKVMRTITKQIDPVMAAASIMQAPRRSLSNSARLLGYVREVDSRKAKQIVEHLDFEVLDQTTRGIWENPPHELLEFVRSLAYAFGNFEPVQSWIEHHEREIQNFPAHFAFIAPSVALRAHNAGKKIELGIASVLGWGLPACILQKIASLDQSAARVLALNHVEQMADNFRIPQSNQCEHLDLFVAVLQAIAPEVLTTAFDLMEPSVVRENWAERLRGSMAERRAAATLVQAAQSCSRLADIAAELRSRFPRASCNAHAPINKLDKDKL
jgi:hypothetical protein